MLDKINEGSADDKSAPLLQHFQKFDPLSIPLGELFNFLVPFRAQNYHVRGQGLREEALLYEVVKGIVESPGASAEDVTRVNVE